MDSFIKLPHQQMYSVSILQWSLREIESICVEQLLHLSPKQYSYLILLRPLKYPPVHSINAYFPQFSHINPPKRTTHTLSQLQITLFHDHLYLFITTYRQVIKDKTVINATNITLFSIKYRLTRQCQRATQVLYFSFYAMIARIV